MASGQAPLTAAPTTDAMARAGMSEIIADRFEIERVAGQGGMGTVFRARDRRDGAPVALKVVEGDHANARFEREALLLADLVHPNIVRYVAHGAMDGRRLYLAMDWLEGVDLDTRLATGPLSVPATLEIASCIASALDAAHKRGVVHRDVKPSNVMLVQDVTARATLVDFGIARVTTSTRAMTVTGAVIGTPAYMAPEQARGGVVDARADLFSLGCVLFECLAGHPAFAGETAIAVLAKILLEPAPNLATIRNDVPPELASLVASLLEKEPGARPANAGAVLDVLARMGTWEGPTRTSPLVAIGATEARVATVLFARDRRKARGDLALAATQEELSAVTSDQIVEKAVQAFGLRLTTLSDGTMVGVAETTAAARDAALGLVRCARALSAALPDGVVAVATGRAVIGAIPVGDAIDGAARLLARLEDATGTWVDPSTASMCEGHFVVREEALGLAVVGERDAGGRELVTPFVGREREVELVLASVRECIDEPVAGVALVTAPPGVGKSRLAREIRTRLEREAAPPRTWSALADPLMRESPYALAGDLLRRALDLRDDGPIVERRARLLARVGAVVGPDRAAFVARRFGEVAGVPFDDSEDPTLRAARERPGVLGTQLTEAMRLFVRATLATPLVIVIEDLHWADDPSMRLLEGLLADLAESPLFFLALTRPSTTPNAPPRFERARVTRMELQPLLPKAATKLARAMLPDADDTAVERIVQRAQGNALFVEELVRYRAEGREATELPPTVAAATEARLLAFPTNSRRVLRAAAIFGERFWPKAVAHLVAPVTVVEVERTLADLEAASVVASRAESRFSDQRELVFVHALVRDAAYAMFTDEDRRVGHALAGDWLAERTHDAAVLAHHYELGGRNEDAAQWHVVAAEDALTTDRATARDHAGRAVRCGASGTMLGRARLVETTAALTNNENVAARALGLEALELLERGSAPWFTALGATIAATGKLEDVAGLAALADRLRATPAMSTEAGRARAITSARLAIQLCYLDGLDLARTLLADALEEPGARGDLAVEAWLRDAEFERRFASGEIIHPSWLEETSSLYERLGDQSAAIAVIPNRIVILVTMGDYEAARAFADEMRAMSSQVSAMAAIAAVIDAAIKAQNGDFADYRAFVEAIKHSSRVHTANRLGLALHIFLHGDLEEARAELGPLLEASVSAPPFHSVTLALAACVAARDGRAQESIDYADRANAAKSRGMAIWGASMLDLAMVVSRVAAGREAEADAFLRTAMENMYRRAEELGEHGPPYIAHGLGNAPLRQLARERGIERER